MSKQNQELVINDKRGIQQVQPQNKPATIEETLHIAVQQKYDVEAIKELVALKRTLDEDAAKKAFNVALAKVQEEMHPVIARGENKHTNSMYGKLEDINIMLMPIIGKHGFSISFNQEKSEIEKHIRIVGELSHEAGYSKKYHVDLPLDQAGIGGKPNKTMMHATGSSFSYGQRYLVKMIFNVAIVGEDDDGNAASATEKHDYETITEEQAEYLNKGFDLIPKRKNQFLAAYSISKIEDLPIEKFEEVKSKVNYYVDKGTEKKDADTK